MYDFIPSRTVREYVRKIQHPFSDMDIAAILYHALPCGERTPALRELAARTEDAALRRQIKEQLAYETLLRGTGALDELFRHRKNYLTATEGGRKPC